MKAFIFFLFLAFPAFAQVAPGGFPTAFANAKCGDVIQLTGAHRPLSVSGKVCPKDNPIKIVGPATIDTWRFTNPQGMEFSNLTIKSSLNGIGLKFEGNNFLANGQPNFRCQNIKVSKVRGAGALRTVPKEPFVVGAGKGLSFLYCDTISVTDSYFSGWESGVLIGVTKNFEFQRNTCEFNSSDCFVLGQTWYGLVQDNMTGSSIVAPGAHPDGIVQAYSRYFYPNSLIPAPPTSDIIVRRNRMVSAGQGIFFGNHDRVYADGLTHNDGGFDRIVVEENDVAMGGGNAITLGSARNSKLRNNSVVTFALAPFMAKYNLPGTVLLENCGNYTGPFGTRPASQQPAC